MLDRLAQAAEQQSQLQAMVGSLGHDLSTDGLTGVRVTWWRATSPTQKKSVLTPPTATALHTVFADWIGESLTNTWTPSPLPDASSAGGSLTRATEDCGSRCE